MTRANRPLFHGLDRTLSRCHEHLLLICVCCQPSSLARERHTLSEHSILVARWTNLHLVSSTTPPIQKRKTNHAPIHYVHRLGEIEENGNELRDAWQQVSWFYIYTHDWFVCVLTMAYVVSEGMQLLARWIIVGNGGVINTDIIKEGEYYILHMYSWWKLANNLRNPLLD